VPKWLVRTDRRRCIGGHRHTIRIRLHQWSWGMRPVAPFAAIDGRHWVFHVQWFRHSVCLASSAGGLDMIKLTAFIAGLLFGLGLLLAGMANPSKVLAFLDLTGAWDPSLGLVMVGAIGVAFGPLTWARRQSSSL